MCAPLRRAVAGRDMVPPAPRRLLHQPRAGGFADSPAAPTRGAGALPESDGVDVGVEEEKLRYRKLQRLCDRFDGFEGGSAYAPLDKPKERDGDADFLGEPFLRDVAGEAKAAEPPPELGSQAGHKKSQPVSNNLIADNSK